jgi:hypothetical protein
MDRDLAVRRELVEADWPEVGYTQGTLQSQDQQRFLVTHMPSYW